MPLVSPFRTSFGTQTARDVLILRAVTSDGEGWGECVAMSDPLYSSEYVDATTDVLRRFLLPALSAAPEPAHLIAHPLNNLRMAMPDAGRQNPAEEVEVFPALRVGDQRAITLDQHE